ncbi:MAG: hypothetical protein V3R25_09930 [Nitrosomonadaceae bacterium]
MSVISSLPHRGDKIIEENGSGTESLLEFMSDLYESNNQDNPKNNYRATVAPTITNNTSEGYTVGSEWIDAPTVYRLTSFTGADANWSALN